MKLSDVSIKTYMNRHRSKMTLHYLTLLYVARVLTSAQPLKDHAKSTLGRVISISYC